MVVVGLAAVGIGGWQLRRNLSTRTEELSEQLASLTATQQAMLAQQRPPEITGRCYLGEKSKPAVDIEVQLFRFSAEPQMQKSGVVTRRFRTDSEGHFASGLLQQGEYCILAPILSPDGEADSGSLLFKQLQSRPLYMTLGVGTSAVDLDLAASGQRRARGRRNTGQLPGW